MARSYTTAGTLQGLIEACNELTGDELVLETNGRHHRIRCGEHTLTAWDTPARIRPWLDGYARGVAMAQVRRRRR